MIWSNTWQNEVLIRLWTKHDLIKLLLCHIKTSSDLEQQRFHHKFHHRSYLHYRFTCVYIYMYRPFLRARREFGTSIAPCQWDVWLPFRQQRRVHGHFTQWSLSFRFKSMSEEKWRAGQGHKGRTCPLWSIILYFPTMRSSFIRRASKGRKEKDWRENSNLKTLFYKVCSLGSVKKLTTNPY